MNQEIPKLTRVQRKLVRLASRLGLKVRYDQEHVYKYDKDLWKSKGLEMVGMAPGVCQLLEDENGQQYISSPIQFDDVDFLHELGHVLIAKFFPQYGIEKDEVEAGIVAIEQIISRKWSRKLAKQVNRTHNHDYQWSGPSNGWYGKHNKNTESAWHWVRSDDHRSDLKFWRKKLAPILKGIE